MNKTTRYVLNSRLETMLQLVTRLSRPQRRFLQLTLDTLVLGFCAWFAIHLTHDDTFTHYQMYSILFAPVAGLPLYVRFGLYRAVLRYISDKILWAVAKAIGLTVIVWGAILFFLALAFETQFSYLLPIIFGVFAFTITLISRFAAKNLIDINTHKEVKRCAIYGAGSAGLQYFNALIASGTTEVVGLFDDDDTKYGREIHGVRILPPSQIEECVNNLGITSVVICMPSVSNRRRSQVAAFLSQFPVKVMMLPSIPDLFDSKYQVVPFDDLDINELLSRTPIPPDQRLIKETANNKVALVSGAGGSVGSRLVETLAENGANAIIMLDHSEHALFELKRKLEKKKTGCELIPILGSVLDEQLLERVFEQHQPSTVFHAAAYKHVAIAEENPASTFTNNVIGTRTLLNAAKAGNVDHFVFITTDKAVNPTSVMGASKRLAELLVSGFAKKMTEGQVYISVRFGNVIGSQGSVIPIFKEQIRAGGPVTVRGKDTTRYFMSIAEACSLIIQAAGIAKGGETFMLKMGQPVSIYDLARNMIELSGLTVRDDINPMGDIEIAITKMGQGEKVFEDLMDDQTTYVDTIHPKIVLAREQDEFLERIDGDIEDIDHQIAGLSVADARNLIMTKLKEQEDYYTKRESV